MSDLPDLLEQRAAEVPFDPSVPAGLRRRIRVRRALLVGGATISLAALVTTGAVLTGQFDQSMPIPPAVDDPSPAGAPLGSFRRLEPGTWRADEFAVPFSFSIEEPWTSLEHGPHFTALEANGRGDLAFGIPDAFIDPEDGHTHVAAPVDVVAWLEAHPRVEVIDVRTYALGDIEGAEVRMRAANVVASDLCGDPFRRCVPLTISEGAPTSLQIHERPRTVWFFEVDSELITVTQDAYNHPRAFDALARELLASVRFD